MICTQTVYESISIHCCISQGITNISIALFYSIKGRATNIKTTFCSWSHKTRYCNGFDSRGQLNVLVFISLFVFLNNLHHSWKVKVGVKAPRLP